MSRKRLKNNKHRAMGQRLSGNKKPRVKVNTPKKKE